MPRRVDSFRAERKRQQDLAQKKSEQQQKRSREGWFALGKQGTDVFSLQEQNYLTRRDTNYITTEKSPTGHSIPQANAVQIVNRVNTGSGPYDDRDLYCRMNRGGTAMPYKSASGTNRGANAISEGQLLQIELNGQIGQLTDLYYHHIGLALEDISVNNSGVPSSCTGYGTYLLWGLASDTNFDPGATGTVPAPVFGQPVYAATGSPGTPEYLRPTLTPGPRKIGSVIAAVSADDVDWWFNPMFWRLSEGSHVLYDRAMDPTVTEGMPVWFDVASGTWLPALADSAGTLAGGIATFVEDFFGTGRGNVIVGGSYWTPTPHGLPARSSYWLSDTVPGALRDTPPLTPGTFEQELLIVRDDAAFDLTDLSALENDIQIP